MNLLTEGIGWRWVRFGRAYSNHLRIARRCPEIARECNRGAFWRFVAGLCRWGIFLPVFALVLVAEVLDRIYRRALGVLPDFEDRRDAAVKDAHKILPPEAVDARIGRVPRRVLTKKPEYSEGA